MELKKGSKVRNYFSFKEFSNEVLDRTPYISLAEYTALEGKKGFASKLQMQLANGFQMHQFKVIKH